MIEYAVKLSQGKLTFEMEEDKTYLTVTASPKHAPEQTYVDSVGNFDGVTDKEIIDVARRVGGVIGLVDAVVDGVCKNVCERFMIPSGKGIEYSVACDYCMNEIRSLVPRELACSQFVNVDHSFNVSALSYDFQVNYENSNSLSVSIPQNVMRSFFVQDRFGGGTSPDNLRDHLKSFIQVAVLNFRNDNPGDFEVMCIENAGFESEFDENVTYLASESSEGDGFFTVWNRYGKKGHYLTNRFRRVR